MRVVPDLASLEESRIEVAAKVGEGARVTDWMRRLA
jgi:hypothetical protein